MRFMCLASLAVLFFTAAPQQALCQEDLASSYGFTGLEIYKVDRGIYNLVFEDLNSDGVRDIGFINNARSRVELYLRLPDDAPDVYEVQDPDAMNELTYDGRYRKEYISVEQQVLGLALGRFDTDDDVDTAMIVNTGELIIDFRGDERRTVKIEGFDPRPQGLRGCDVDGDGKDDLICMGEKKTLFWRNKGEAFFRAEPQPFFHTVEKPGSFRVADLDGNGLADLLYVYYENDHPFHVRFQESPGIFGPVTAAKMEAIRAFDVQDTDDDGSAEVLAVYANSGRLVRCTLKPAEDAMIESHPLRRVKGENERSFVAADLDSDGMSEVIVAEAESARILVISGLGRGAGAAMSSHPSLKGVKNPRVADLDGDGSMELIVISGKEKVIGISPAGKTIAFPRFVPVDGEPAAMDVGDVDGDGTEDVVCISTRGIGRKKEYILNVLCSAEEGAKAESSVIQEASAKEKALGKDPLDVLLIDFNRDGLDDLFVFMDKEVPVLFLNRGEGRFEFAMGEETPGLGLLENAREWTVCPVDSDNDAMPELMACSGNLVRFIYLPDGSKVPQALSQHNSPDEGCVLAGCAFGDVTGDGAQEILLYEAKNRRIHVVSGGGGKITKIDVGEADFMGIEAVELNNDGIKDILVMGLNRIGVCLSGKPCLVMKENGIFESEDRDTYLLDVAVGDVNSDGTSDALLLDSGEKSVFIIALGSEKLTQALRFKVFEEKLFQSGRGGAEPHGVSVEDVTGDNKKDVIVLVHDKIIIYPQQ